MSEARTETRGITRELLHCYAVYLRKLAAMNGLLDFCGWSDLKVKPIRIQKSMFRRGDKELTRRVENLSTVLISGGI